MLTRKFYTRVFYLTLPFILLRLAWRSRRLPAYKKNWSERLGVYTKDKHLKNSIWIHATSVGETYAALPLVSWLQKHYPKTPLIITNTTPTGLEAAKRLFNGTTHGYVPFDLPIAIRHFLASSNPILLIIMETELWPNIVHQCAKQNIPILLANARLSSKSAKNYKYIHHITRKMLHKISYIAAQTQEDANRFTALGAFNKKINITGNLKFNVKIPGTLPDEVHHFRNQYFGGNTRPIFIAASTHDGEEMIILDAFKEIQKQIPNIILLLAPRHPDRFETVAELCKRASFNLSRYSEGDACSSSTDVLLGDTMGQLLLFYAASDVAFIGGSLKKSNGGHNLIEPAILARPIITGIHLRNWTAVAGVLSKADALIQVDNGKELSTAVIDLMRSKNKRLQYGKNAQKAVNQYTHALEKHTNCINLLLAKAPKSFPTPHSKYFAKISKN